MIEIKREAGWEDKLRKYKVMLNEKEIGTIGSNDCFEYPVDPGLHNLYLKIDWCRSEKLEFKVKDKETVRFECGGLQDPGFLSLMLHITFKRNRYLWIKQVNS